MAESRGVILRYPERDKPLEDEGSFTLPWTNFFREIVDRLNPLGRETSFDLLNNRPTAVEIETMSFTFSRVSVAFVDYLIQRITTGTGAVENVEAGTFIVAYKPASSSWVLVNGPSSAGITLSITATGQIKYTSSNITGTPSISRIVVRARTLDAKSKYSKVGK